LVDQIRELKHGYTTAVLSNAFDELRRLLVEEWLISDAFHHLIISAEVGMMKPDPAIFQLALEITGFEADETLFIDDSLDNIRSAEEIGMHTIHFNSAQQTRDELRNLLHN
jgi:HAD superfamily hydrolase (TIGR01509 family)